MQTHRVTRDHVPSALPAPPDDEPSSMLRRFAGGISQFTFAMFSTVTPPASQSTTPALPELELPVDEGSRSTKDEPDETDAAVARALAGPSRLPVRPRTPMSPVRRRPTHPSSSRRSPRVSNWPLYLSSPPFGFTPQLMPLPLVSPINSRESSVARKCVECRNPMTATWVDAHALPEDTLPTTSPPKEVKTPPSSPTPLSRQRPSRTPESVPVASSSSRPSSSFRMKLGPQAASHPYRTPTKSSTMKAVAVDPLRPVLPRSVPRATAPSSSGRDSGLVSSRPHRTNIKRPRSDGHDTPRTPKRTRHCSLSASPNAMTEHRFASHTLSTRSSLTRQRTVKVEADEPCIPSTSSRAGKSGNTSCDWSDGNGAEVVSHTAERRGDVPFPGTLATESASVCAQAKQTHARHAKQRRLDAPDDAEEADQVAANLWSSSGDEHNVGSTYGDDPFDDVREPTDPGLHRSITHLSTHLGVRPASLRCPTAVSCPPALLDSIRSSPLKSGAGLFPPGPRSAPVDTIRVHALVADPVKPRDVRASALVGSGQTVQAALLAAALESPASDRKGKSKQGACRL